VTRVRFDPSFVEDERWERLGGDALVLHVTALSYVTRTLSDGVLTRKRLRVLTPLVDDPMAVAELLLADGLWLDLGDGSLQVCTVRDDLRFSDDRGDDQPSRKYVESERARATERKARWKAKQAEREAERVPNASQNDGQGSADQPSAVQDPKGPSPASARGTLPASQDLDRHSLGAEARADARRALQTDDHRRVDQEARRLLDDDVWLAGRATPIPQQIERTAS
jgi:hypothetical protein